MLTLSEMSLWKKQSPTVSGAFSTARTNSAEEYKSRGGFLESGIWNLVADVDSDGNEELIKITQKRIEGERTSYKVIANLVQNGKESIIVENTGGPFSWAKLVNLNNYGPKEFLFETVEGQLGYVRFYRYENGKFIYVPLTPETGWPGFAGTGGVHLWKTDGEVLVYFPIRFGSPLRGECNGKGELYKYYNHTLVKLYNISLAPEWCREFRG